MPRWCVAKHNSLGVAVSCSVLAPPGRVPPDTPCLRTYPLDMCPSSSSLFVAVFLLHQWTLQNTCPGALHDDKLAGGERMPTTIRSRSQLREYHHTSCRRRLSVLLRLFHPYVLRQTTTSCHGRGSVSASTTKTAMSKERTVLFVRSGFSLPALAEVCGSYGGGGKGVAVEGRDVQRLPVLVPRRRLVLTDQTMYALGRKHFLFPSILQDYVDTYYIKPNIPLAPSINGVNVLKSAWMDE